MHTDEMHRLFATFPDSGSYRGTVENLSVHVGSCEKCHVAWKKEKPLCGVAFSMLNRLLMDARKATLTAKAPVQKPMNRLQRWIYVFRARHLGYRGSV